MLFKKKSKNADKDRVLTAIKQNLEMCYSRHITFNECLLQTGPMTADLFTKYSVEESLSKNAYDTILVIAINYYTMLHMDLYNGFYAVNRAHTYSQVAKLVEEALEDINKNGGFKAHRYEHVLRESRDFTNQIVEVYYRMGTCACHPFVISSIYSVLLSMNMRRIVGRDQIENTLRTIDAEKIFRGKHHYGYSQKDVNLIL